MTSPLCILFKAKSPARARFSDEIALDHGVPFNHGSGRAVMLKLLKGRKTSVKGVAASSAADGGASKAGVAVAFSCVAEVLDARNYGGSRGTIALAVIESLLLLIAG